MHTVIASLRCIATSGALWSFIMDWDMMRKQETAKGFQFSNDDERTYRILSINGNVVTGDVLVEIVTTTPAHISEETVLTLYNWLESEFSGYIKEALIISVVDNPPKPENSSETAKLSDKPDVAFWKTVLSFNGDGERPSTTVFASKLDLNYLKDYSGDLDHYPTCLLHAVNDQLLDTFKIVETIKTEGIQMQPTNDEEEEKVF